MPKACSRDLDVHVCFTKEELQGVFWFSVEGRWGLVAADMTSAKHMEHFLTCFDAVASQIYMRFV